ncbi:MAG TPA: DegT/DnrJ/EryC1/StrS family aminotransferase [Tepidisphaeraceae bacterium]
MTQLNEPCRVAAASGPKTVVPLADLRAQYNEVRAEMIAELLEVAGSTNYILGPKVAQFEEDFARYVGVKHAIGVNSGTSALHLALIGAGVEAGDEVITVPMTFIATSWAISYCHATPVYVDIDPKTYTMDPEQIERRITSKTKAILPVHLYGQCADMDAILAIGNKYGIPVIEDAAQAHGASLLGRNAGTMGMAGCFSFYPGKNLGAYGEAGAVVTNDDDLAKRYRALRDHAQDKRYHHSEIGFNYRMDGMQGAVLGVKLKHLEKWTEKRIRFADRYRRMLNGLPIELPTMGDARRHVWHLYVALHPQRDRVRQELETQGIHTGLHYPIPLHLQKAYAHLGGQVGDYPVAEKVANQCLTLPLFAEMTEDQQDAVVDALTNVLSEEAWQ